MGRTKFASSHNKRTINDVDTFSFRILLHNAFIAKSSLHALPHAVCRLAFISLYIVQILNIYGFLSRCYVKYEYFMRKLRLPVIKIHVLRFCDTQLELRFLVEMLYLVTEVKRHHARLTNWKKKWKERADVRALTYGLTLATHWNNK